MVINNKETYKLDESLLEEVILSSCYEVGAKLSKECFSITDLSWKELDDPVTNLDKDAEQMLINKISKNFNANFLGEEYGQTCNGSDLTIYLDPIDGTKSFVKGDFLSSISVAASYKNKLVFGAVYDFMRDVMYYANSEGAKLTRSSWLSNQSINLPRENKFSKLSVLYSDTDDCLDFQKISSRTQSGSMALSMAQVAAGTHQGLIARPYFKNGESNICDIAAGYFIMLKSGLEIKDFYLNDYDYKNPSRGCIAGSNEFINLVYSK